MEIRPSPGEIEEAFQEKTSSLMMEANLLIQNQFLILMIIQHLDTSCLSTTVEINALLIHQETTRSLMKSSVIKLLLDNLA
jgi:hypothetical protein